MSTAELVSRKNRSGPVRYHLIADDLRQQISSGQLRAGDKLPSYLEMQNNHGWATYTVDRAYTVLEREGLIERRGRSGVYVADASTRRVQGLVGLACSTFAEYQHHPYFTELLAGIQQTFESEGVPVLLLSGKDPESQWSKVGGVLLYEGQPALDILAETLPPGFPAVSLFERSTRQDVPAVVTDDYSGARQAVEHLLELGHRHIACIMTASLPILRPRLAGYKEALQDAGIEPLSRWQRDLKFFHPHHNFIEAGRATMRQWLTDDWGSLGCTAILCQNDEVAAGVMQALAETGVEVPAQVSVVGFDDQRICTLVSPCLTTVQVPLRQMGIHAAQLMLGLLRGEGNGVDQDSNSVVLPVQLVIRDSTAPPPTLA